MKEFNVETSETGVRYTLFRDNYDGIVKVKESPTTLNPCLWLGIDYLLCGQKGDVCLTQDNAKGLAQILEAFAETGRLP